MTDEWNFSEDFFLIHVDDTENEPSKATTEKRHKRKKFKKEDKCSKKQKMFKIRPNYFLGFQISDVLIHMNVRNIQEKIIETENSLYPALIKIPTLHITLAVSHLPTEKDVAVVASKLDEWGANNAKNYFNPITLKFEGLDSFKNNVLFVKIKKDDNLKHVVDLAKQMEDIFLSCGFANNEKREFQPHLTILKLSKSIDLSKKSKKYKTFFEKIKATEDYIGCQTVNSIQLLSMNRPKNEKGYYYCSSEVKLIDHVSGDHSFCCSPLPRPVYMNKLKQDLSVQKMNTRKNFHTIAFNKFQNLFSSPSCVKDKDTQSEQDNLIQLVVLVGAIGLVAVFACKHFLSR